jgi:hypothetical protein
MARWLLPAKGLATMIDKTRLADERFDTLGKESNGF